MDALVRERSVRCATDYTLRLCEPYLAAERIGRELGPLLRLAIRAPSRTAVMAIDLAAAFAGPVDAVLASARYPAAFAERVATRRAAFAPTLILEHHGGCVSTVVPVPHAVASEAFALMASFEHGRIDVALPAGGVTLTRSFRGARSVVETMREAPPQAVDPRAIYGIAMRRLVRRFVDACAHEGPVHAPLTDEIHVRATWRALETAVCSGGRVYVPKRPRAGSYSRRR